MLYVGVRSFKVSDLIQLAEVLLFVWSDTSVYIVMPKKEFEDSFN